MYYYLLQVEPVWPKTLMTIAIVLFGAFMLISLFWEDIKGENKPDFDERKRFQAGVKTKNPDIIHALAMKYAYPGGTDKALYYLTKALEINPNHFKSRLDKLIILNGEGRYYEAKSLMEGFIEEKFTGNFDIKEEYHTFLPRDIKAHILYFYGYLKNADGKFSEAENLKL